MVLKITKLPCSLFITSLFMVVIFSFYGCEKENDKPKTLNDPPVVSIYANPKEGEVPIQSKIQVDGTDKDGKSDIANYSLEIKKLDIKFNQSKPIDTLFSFSESGEYTVKGAVLDKAGDSDSESLKLNFSEKPSPENNPPVASVSVSPKEGEAPLESRIEVNGTDKDSLEDIQNYYLIINELETNIKKNNPIDTTFLFSESGQYTLIGVVEDKSGARDTLEVLVNVNKPENNPPVASVSANPAEGIAPFESRIEIGGSDEDGIEDIKKYYLEIDKLEINIERTNPIDTNIVFSDYGDYNVRGIVEDSKGARDSLEVLLTVEKPEVSISHSANLIEDTKIRYQLNFENTDAVGLDIFKDGEKILSRNIENPEYSEIFDYSSNEDITKGNYEFIANFKTKDGENSSISSNVEIPNYNPSVDWSDLDINFDENSNKTVTLPVPTDKNPEDNPVKYIPESFSSDKADLEFNLEDRKLNIVGLPNRYGEYSISAEYGSNEGGIGNTSKNGVINEVLLPGMNPFATPNIFGQDEHKWEYASREEKLEMLDEANMQDKSWEWEYIPGKFSCGGFAKLKLVNMFGCENFEDYDYFNNFKDYYKKEKNGKFNIPVYRVATDVDPDKFATIDATQLYGHEINGTWVGPDNNVEKRDATNFDQWVFFEPQSKGENGTYYVQPGDWQMDDNGEVRIYWFGNSRSSLNGEWGLKDKQILQYKLTDGKAELDVGFSQDGVANRFIKYDPYQ
ncbi:MAG: hypothetical protein ACOCWW_00970 [Bacteroidota bacterium]